MEHLGPPMTDETSKKLKTQEITDKSDPLKYLLNNSRKVQFPHLNKGITFPEKPLSVDGTFGYRTIEWIKKQGHARIAKEIDIDYKLKSPPNETEKKVFQKLDHHSWGFEAVASNLIITDEMIRGY